MDPDELSYIQGQIFSRNLHLPGEFGIDVTKHNKKENNRHKKESIHNYVKENKQRKEPTLLALRTCSRLEGSIPKPEHETKTKSVSCPVCSIFTCKIYIRMISIINTTAEQKNMMSRCLFKESSFVLYFHITGIKQASNERMFTVLVFSHCQQTEQEIIVFLE
jgi:hypothetical protein